MTGELKRLAGRAKSFVIPPRPPAPTHPAASAYPNWSEILGRDWRAWRKLVARTRKGQRVLIATSFGGHAPSAQLESTLAVALTLRGAQVHFLLCDEALAACQMALLTGFKDVSQFVEHGPRSDCGLCFPPSYESYSALGIPIHRYSHYLSADHAMRAATLAETIPLREIAGFTLDGIAVGEHAQAGALRFYARGELEQGSSEERVLRRYFQAALQTTYATQCLLDRHRFSSACFNHGIYVPQGLVGEVARKKGVRVINWAPAYRKLRFIFTHDMTYHHALMTEPTDNWASIDWSQERQDQTLDYLKSRWYGTRDWIWFHEKPEQELSKIAAELGIDFGKPTIGMLTNVMWDAQLHYPANAFPNMLDWVIRTIRYFAHRPDLQLIIRIHPAEIRGTVPSRQPLLAEIQKVFAELPGNVFIVSPESNISTYAAMLQCNSVIIYGTKTGVELTSLGIPVIVAGEAWIRNKGLTYDARSPEDYFQILDRLPLATRLDDSTRTRALKYAYHFFFRRMIPLEMFEPVQGWPFYRLGITRFDELAPGRNPGLDLVCDGILTGHEFVYQQEQYANGSD